MLAGIGTLAVATTIDATFAAAPAGAAVSGSPLPLPPLRIPATDMNVEQQPDSQVQWLQDAKLGMFIHWGVYSGPAQGEWYMHNAPVTPADYRKYVTDATTTTPAAASTSPTTPRPTPEPSCSTPASREL